MSLTREDVQKVSLLARLQLSDDELDRLTVQLSQIVRYVEQLGELDTDEVVPMAHAVEFCNIFAADEPQASLDRQQALAAAPEHDGQSYRVPAVLAD